MRKLSWAYFDTSTYLKLYLLENGSEEARRLVSKYQILSSAVLLTECFSALSRKKEAGGVEERIFNQVVRIIREDLRYVEIIVTTQVGTEGQRGKGTKKEVKQQIGNTTLCLCAFVPMNLSSYKLLM